jgi:hypothetical protein
VGGDRVTGGELAPSLVATVERVLGEEQRGAAVAAVDWSAYRACPVCRVPMGAACRSASGRVVDGHPDGISTELEHAHAARKRRSGR